MHTLTHIGARAQEEEKDESGSGDDDDGDGGDGDVIHSSALASSKYW